ncbi:hypothetical protein QBC40DRAFT_300028 [Triangularia verruculosa]|uniref:Uncharacterized protein n=1 Tax=Triangularia verruculosa TaxID=2587418 RepID=A0AAN6XBV3_9PEZI|nr:hypothetical protein QBC40DRAFT_300028 [Triangularia verruculosa]
MQGAVGQAFKPEHNLWQPASKASLSCAMGHERVEPYGTGYLPADQGVWQASATTRGRLPGDVRTKAGSGQEVRDCEGGTDPVPDNKGFAQVETSECTAVRPHMVGAGTAGTATATSCLSNKSATRVSQSTDGRFTEPSSTNPGGKKLHAPLGRLYDSSTVSDVGEAQEKHVWGKEERLEDGSGSDGAKKQRALLFLSEWLGRGISGLADRPSCGINLGRKTIGSLREANKWEARHRASAGCSYIVVVLPTGTEVNGSRPGRCPSIPGKAPPPFPLSRPRSLSRTIAESQNEKRPCWRPGNGADYAGETRFWSDATHQQSWKGSWGLLCPLSFNTAQPGETRRVFGLVRHTAPFSSSGSGVK